MNLYQKLLTIQSEVKALQKDTTADKYRYISGDKILSHIRPKMEDLHLLLVPDITKAEFTRQDYMVGRNDQRTEKSEMFCHLDITYTWIDADSGEQLPVRWASCGQTGFDKGYGSALTYGERYFLLKFFHVATDRDDVDQPLSAQEEKTLADVIAYIDSITDAATLDDIARQYAPYYGKEKAFKESVAKQKRLIVYGKPAE